MPEVDDQRLEISGVRFAKWSHGIACQCIVRPSRAMPL
jgi:hypothetical protein